MIFDDLHDPRPPRPGMREFAIVTERAQAIRRRRVRRAVRTACALALLAGGASVALLPRGDALDSATPFATVPPTANPIATSAVLLRDADEITALAPVTLPAPGRLTLGSESIELRQTTDGRVCAVRVGDPADERCAAAEAGLVAIELGGTSGGPTPRVVVAVDGGVDVTFLTVGVTCHRPIRDQGGGLDLDVWLCDGLELDRASVEVRSPRLVVISSLPER